MTPQEANAKAHALWHTEGQGVAVAFREHLIANGKLSFGEMVYAVGIAKDEDSLEVYGRSTVSFEAAFANALPESEGV